MSTLLPYELAQGPPMQTGRGKRSSPMSWRWRDRVALVLAWIAGIGLCLIAAALVIYFGFRGVQYLRPSLLFSRPSISTSQSGTGGFLDPLLGTMLLTAIGIVLALPLAVTSAIWIAEYGRPRWLARMTRAPRSIACLMVGSASRTRVSSVILPPSSGTLKSQRKKSRLLSIGRSWMV